MCLPRFVSCHSLSLFRFRCASARRLAGSAVSSIGSSYHHAYCIVCCVSANQTTNLTGMRRTTVGPNACSTSGSAEAWHSQVNLFSCHVTRRPKSSFLEPTCMGLLKRCTAHGDHTAGRIRHSLRSTESSGIAAPGVLAEWVQGCAPHTQPFLAHGLAPSTCLAS